MITREEYRKAKEIVRKYERQEKEYNGCKHDWRYIGHQLNGHKECTKCGIKGDYN
jgi:hypothetical protein